MYKYFIVCSCIFFWIDILIFIIYSLLIWKVLVFLVFLKISLKMIFWNCFYFICLVVDNNCLQFLNFYRFVINFHKIISYTSRVTQDFSITCSNNRLAEKLKPTVFCRKLLAFPYVWKCTSLPGWVKRHFFLLFFIWNSVCQKCVIQFLQISTHLE